MPFTAFFVVSFRWYENWPISEPGQYVRAMNYMNVWSWAQNFQKGMWLTARFARYKQEWCKIDSFWKAYPYQAGVTHLLRQNNDVFSSSFLFFFRWPPLIYTAERNFINSPNRTKAMECGTFLSRMMCPSHWIVQRLCFRFLQISKCITWANTKFEPLSTNIM